MTTDEVEMMKSAFLAITDTQDWIKTVSKRVDGLQTSINMVSDAVKRLSEGKKPFELPSTTPIVGECGYTTPECGHITPETQ